MRVTADLHPLYDVFLSYANSDAIWVEGWLLPRLEAAELVVCTEDNFELGRARIVNIEQAIKDSSVTLLVLTPDWINGTLNHFAGLLARDGDPLGLKQRTIPILLRHCEMPKHIEMLSLADFTNKIKRDAQLVRVVHTIHNISQAGKATLRARIDKEDAPDTQPRFKKNEYVFENIKLAGSLLFEWKTIHSSTQNLMMSLFLFEDGLRFLDNEVTEKFVIHIEQLWYDYCDTKFRKGILPIIPSYVG